MCWRRGLSVGEFEEARLIATCWEIRSSGGLVYLLEDCKGHAGHGQFRELLLELTDLAFGRGGLAAEGFGFIFVAFVFVHDRLAEAV